MSTRGCRLKSSAASVDESDINGGLEDKNAAPIDDAQRLSEDEVEEFRSSVSNRLSLNYTGLCRVHQQPFVVAQQSDTKQRNSASNDKVGFDWLQPSREDRRDRN